MIKCLYSKSSINWFSCSQIWNCTNDNINDKIVDESFFVSVESV